MEKIRQLFHRQSKQMFNVDIYNTVQLRQFCEDMSDDKQWQDRLDGMTHIQILDSLDEAGFESVEIEVDRDVEKEEWNKKNKA